MTQSFTKLFSSITESTVWCEPDQTRICWITMLAMADRNGMVLGSIPGLANRARIPLEAAEEALKTFMLPDKYSRSKTEEGRRIQEVEGGWLLINYDKYRALRDAESVREAKRRYINERRRKEREEAANAPKDVDQNVEEGIDCRAKQKQKQKQKQSKPLEPLKPKSSVQQIDENLAEVSAPRKNGTRLPDDWVLPKPWGEWALTERQEWTPDDVRKCAEIFRDHWHANGNQRTAKKLDWEATWRNWVRRTRDTAKWPARKQSTLGVDFDSIDYGQHIRAIS